jgi:CPA2 family monovalent cation:H+ antiporter-2
MHDLVYLRDLVVILTIAVAVVALLHRLKIPPIAAFILAGMLAGPESLGLVNDVKQVEALAEIGAALLLFGIGLELSLEKLRRLWRPIVMSGLLQVGLSVAAAFAIARLFGLPDEVSLLVGFVAALSSTAIVLRGLEARGEIDAPHGRLTVGILVFQDLCVVPMALAIPLLGGADTPSQEVSQTLLRAPLILIGVLVVAAYIVPRALRLIVRTRQRHLFVMAILLICIGVAYVISSSGVSLALGAFLAGLVVGGSEFRHQAISDVIPFRDVFTSLFFVSVGMLISPAHIIEQALPICLILAAILIGKPLIVLLVGLIMRLPVRVALLSAVALAQVGEFSFILVRIAQGTDLAVEPLTGNLLAAATLSMFVTPFALSLGPRLAAGVGRLRVLDKYLRLQTAEDAAEVARSMHGHIIIAGYGFAGRQLAHSFQQCGVPYLVADLNLDNVREAQRRGVSAYLADVTSEKVLELLGLEHAKELVVVINDPMAVAAAVRTARAAHPNLHIIARTTYLRDIEPLLKAGASRVVSGERQAAVEIAHIALSRCQLASRDTEAELERIRTASED